MAKRTDETIVIDGRQYRVRDTKRTTRRRIQEGLSPQRVAASKVLPISDIPPARETSIKPVERRRKKEAAVFHGGHSDKSISLKQQPAVVPMSREEMQSEYRDRALKYGAAAAFLSVPVRAVAESRKTIRPMADEWDKARRRMQGHIFGRMTGSPRSNTLSPEEYAQAVRRNASTLNKLPSRIRAKVGPSIVEGLGGGNYAQHAKIAALRSGFRLGLPLAGAGAAGLQYLYDRNRKHYRIDYRGQR